MTEFKLVPMEPTLDMLCEGTDVYGSEDCAETDVLGIYKAMLSATPAVQGEPVGWQYYQDGKWWHGDDRIKDHRKNTEEAGFPVRDVYAAPQPPPDVSALVEALENAARSLRTISKKAGIDEFMSEMCEVRGYAESRAWCAEKDLAAFRQGGEE